MRDGVFLPKLKVEHRILEAIANSAAPRSNHRGGVNVAFVDGHVTFLTDSVDLEAMAYLISIDDGQIRPVDEYVR